MVRSGLREKTYAYTRQAEQVRTQCTHRSNLLLEVQTVKPLELLDEGLFDKGIFRIPRLQVAGPSLVSTRSLV